MKTLEIRENRENKGDIDAKLSTSQLAILYYKPWYQCNANTWHVYLMVQYANYIKIIFMNIN